VITPRLQLIMKKGADRRRENLPVTDEIALLIPNEEDKPDSREVILTARGAIAAKGRHRPTAAGVYSWPVLRGILESD
jgi:hypothetical protein